MHCVRACAACAVCVRLHACVHQRRTLSCAVSTRERLLVDRNDELEDRLRDYENMQACALCIPTMQMRSGVHATDDARHTRVP